MTTWKVKGRNPDRNTLEIHSDDKRLIAEVHPWPFYEAGKQEQTAKLIALAPELEKALAQIVCDYSDESCSGIGTVAENYITRANFLLAQLKIEKAGAR